MTMSQTSQVRSVRVGASNLLGCPGQEVIGSLVRINGLFHLLMNGVYWGYNTLTKLLLTSWDPHTTPNPESLEV